MTTTELLARPLSQRIYDLLRYERRFPLTPAEAVELAKSGAFDGVRFFRDGTQLWAEIDD